MQSPIHPSSQQVSFNTASFQSKLTPVLESVRVLIALTGMGLVIAAILLFQQFLIQLYSTRWQIALLFALLGLMVTLLFGQYHFNQTPVKAAKGMIRWSALFSLMISLFGIGVVTCILTTAPPLM